MPMQWLILGRVQVGSQVAQVLQLPPRENSLQIKLLKVPGGILTFPRLPRPSKQSLRTDAEHLVPGENDGFAGPP